MKKNDKRISQYDDYTTEYTHKKKEKKKKDNNFDYEFSSFDFQKQKANNRYLNKKRDKNKHNRYDDWN